MKRKTMFKSLLALVLVLALGSGTMLTRQTLAQGSLGITGDASTLNVNLGTGFTYQGRLSDASGPVDGTCDLTFNCTMKRVLEPHPPVARFWVP